MFDDPKLLALRIMQVLILSLPLHTAYSTSSSPSNAIDLGTPTKHSDSAKPVLRLELTNSMNGAIGSGGFDVVVNKSSGTWYHPTKLGACGEAIIAGAEVWASKRSLRTLTIKVSHDRAVIHLDVRDGSGFLEIRYRLSENRERAEISVSFHDLNGTALTPSRETYGELEMAVLARELKTKMMCNTT